MKKQAFCAAAVSSVLLFGGCGNQQPGTADKSAGTTVANPTPSSSLVETKPTAENTVVIINGKPISKAFFQSLVADMTQRSGGQPVPEDKLLEGLIARELLNQEAEKQNLAKTPEIAAKLDNARRDVLVQAAVENFRKTATVSDEDIKKEYDTRVGALSSTEYKARHILLENEQAAKDVIAKLQKGAKFDELAKKLSKDPSAKQNGGDLGWFNPKQMVPEFSAAVAGLKNGETTQAPIKSQFGWHVILREESREQAAPPFDAVKDQFRNMLVGQKLQKHVEDLKAAAKIERLTPPKPPETAKPETTAPAPSAATPPAPATPQAATKLNPVEAGKPVEAAPARAPSAPAQPPSAPAAKPAQ